jgi:5-methylcytosine-specific restriction endonuclease McrA
MDGAGDVTTREVSDPVALDDRHFEAHCHLRDANRTFTIANVRRAVDAETGEIVPDIRPLLGLAPLPPPMPGRNPAPPPVDRKRHTLPAAEYDRLRREQRRALERAYRLEPIFDLYRQRLIDAFGGRCARCGALSPVVLDHHVPLALGGVLQPGNIVPLCRHCNDAKHEQPPERFYSAEQLAWIDERLAEQPAIMAFEFNWRRWHYGDRDARRAYLVEVGLGAEILQAVFDDPEHRWYVSDPDQGMLVTITLPLSEADIAEIPARLTER